MFAPAYELKRSQPRTSLIRKSYPDPVRDVS